MTDPKTQQTEEQWWEVTTTAGLMLVLPAPSLSTDVATLLNGGRTYVTSRSEITGRTYTLNLSHVLMIKEYPMKADLNRHERSVARLLGISSGSASDDGQDLASPSGTTANPGGPSTGGPTKRRILH